jgi:restriction endonuclease S subunit
MGGNRLRLDELVSVKTGLVLARKQAKHPSDVMAKYRQLNLKAIDSKGYIDENSLEEFCANERLKAEYLTQPGDVIVRLTTPYTAVLIDEEFAGMVIPSHFIVIRTRGRKILSEYLYWLLNTDKVKASILQNISSIMIGTVKPASYAEMEIELLSLDEQRKISEMNVLAKKEIHLLDRLIGQKELYYKVAIDKAQKEMRKRKNEDY